MDVKLTFEEWLATNEDESMIAAAETGADRELDYNAELYLEKCYDAYLRTE